MLSTLNHDGNGNNPKLSQLLMEYKIKAPPLGFKVFLHLTLS